MSFNYLGNPDSPEYLKVHRKLIQKKSFLKQVYLNFYSAWAKQAVKKPIVELGSGGGSIKEIIPWVLTSDIIKGPGIDRVFHAEKMPFESNSIGTFVMLDVLHHIKNPESALKEMQRCLKMGGKIIMTEPFKSLWGGFIYRYIHHEPFNPHADWNTKGKGRMSGANTALPWIIFVRDRKIFQKKFPNLKILKISPHTPFTYLISGGLTKYQFLPTATYSLIRFIENILAPLNPLIGMFVTIELKKI
jgi:SAM-dependent methyltransferase